MLGVLNDFYKFRIVNDSPLGRGIVALEEIEETEIICRFMGPVMSLKEFFEKYDQNGCNVLQIDEDKYVDILPPFLYFNHSCDPNAGIRNNGILFALKKIKKGEEIFFDYSTTADDVIWNMECKCNASKCRKIIGDFQTIPHRQKELYLSKNALTAHIKRKYY